MKKVNLSLIFLIILIIFAIAVPLFSQYDGMQISSEILQAPSRAHLLGTDTLGRDVFTRLFIASRISLTIGILTAILSTAIGMLSGMWAAYIGGKIDSFVARLSEVFLAFPDIMLVLVVVSVIGSGVWKLILLLTLISWPQSTKIVRGLTKSIKEEGYIKYAQIANYPKRVIVYRHIMPNIYATLTVSVVNQVANSILSEASLSYLGMGVPEPLPSWGNMLTDAQNLTILLNSPWVWLPPAIFLFLTVLSVHSFGKILKEKKK